MPRTKVFPTWPAWVKVEPPPTERLSPWHLEEPQGWLNRELVGHDGCEVCKKLYNLTEKPVIIDLFND